MTPMVWHQGIHDKMGMQRMRREGVEGAPGLVPWRGKGRSGTSVFAWCLSEFVGIEYRQPNRVGPTEVIKSNPRDNVYQNQGDQSFEGDQKMSKDKEMPESSVQHCRTCIWASKSNAMGLRMGKGHVRSPGSTRG